MTQEEFLRWAEYDRIEPIGLPGIQHLLAQIAWMVYSAAPGRKKPQKIEDFAPFGLKPDPQSALDQAIAAEFGSMKGPVRGRRIAQE